MEVIGVAGHEDVERALRNSIESSKWAVVATANGDPVYISGLSEWPTGVGCPWLVGTPLIAKHAREFMRTTRNLAEHMADQSPMLINLVATENAVSIRWLRWLGFTVDDTRIVHIREGGIPFYIFIRD